MASGNCFKAPWMSRREHQPCHLCHDRAPYHLFAGRAASRSLTLGSLEENDLELGDDIEDFTEEQIRNLRDQVDFYTEK